MAANAAYQPGVAMRQEDPHLTAQLSLPGPIVSAGDVGKGSSGLRYSPNLIGAAPVQLQRFERPS